MADISVNEYVRTKNKGIKRIDRIEDNKTVNKYLYFIGYDHNDREYGIIKTTEIINHSFNILDLIEVGDIIQLNGAEELKYEVLKISWSKSKGKHIHIINPFRTEGGKDIFIEDIKLIVTKEQFKSMGYRVGGEDG